MNEFMEACVNGRLDIVQSLLNNEQINPSAHHNAAFIWASRKGHLEIVKLLLNDPRVDPSDQNNCAIRWASFNDHLNVVSLLLNDTRVDPSAAHNDAIYWASDMGYTKIIQVLLNDNRVINGNQNAFNHPNIQQILKENKDRKLVIVWFGRTFRKEWRYLCPVIAKNILY